MLDLQKLLTCGVEKTTLNVLDTAEALWPISTRSLSISRSLTRNNTSVSLSWTQEEPATHVLPVKTHAYSNGRTLTRHPVPLKDTPNQVPSIRHLLTRHLLCRRPPPRDTRRLHRQTIPHIPPPHRLSIPDMTHRISNSRRRPKVHRRYRRVHHLHTNRVRCSA